MPLSYLDPALYHKKASTVSFCQSPVHNHMWESLYFVEAPRSNEKSLRDYFLGSFY